MSNHRTSAQSGPSLAICLHLSDLEIKKIGSKQRAEIDFVYRYPSQLNQCICRYICMSQINSLKNNTCATVSLTLLFKNAEAKKCVAVVFKNIFNIACHTYNNLIRFVKQLASFFSTSCETISKSQVTHHWMFSAFFFSENIEACQSLPMKGSNSFKLSADHLSLLYHCTLAVQSMSMCWMGQMCDCMGAVRC